MFSRDKITVDESANTPNKGRARMFPSIFSMLQSITRQRKEVQIDLDITRLSAGTFESKLPLQSRYSPLASYCGGNGMAQENIRPKKHPKLTIQVGCGGWKLMVPFSLRLAMREKRAFLRAEITGFSLVSRRNFGECRPVRSRRFPTRRLRKRASKQAERNR